MFSIFLLLLSNRYIIFTQQIIALITQKHDKDFFKVCVVGRFEILSYKLELALWYRLRDKGLYTEPDLGMGIVDNGSRRQSHRDGEAYNLGTFLLLNQLNCGEICFPNGFFL